jgi:hypothetical protein
MICIMPIYIYQTYTHTYLPSNPNEMRMIAMTYAVSPPVGTCHPKDPGDHRCRPTFEQWKWLGRPRRPRRPRWGWTLSLFGDAYWFMGNTMNHGIFYDFLPCWGPILWNDADWGTSELVGGWIFHLYCISLYVSKMISSVGWRVFRWTPATGEQRRPGVCFMATIGFDQSSCKRQGISR